MRSITRLGLAIAALVAATPALALSAETWVSGTGTDSGACTRAAPCRSFQFAHDKTTSGGQVNVLTPANYGPLTINKAVSIVADNVEALINTATFGSIFIQAPNAIVALRGLTLLGVADHVAIRFDSGAALHVEGCTVRGGTTGIGFYPAAGSAELYVSDTIVANSTSIGIEVRPGGSGSAKAIINRTEVMHAGSHGMHFNDINSTGSVRATVTDSGVSRADAGIRLDALNSTEATLDRVTLSDNTFGVYSAGPAAIARVGNSTVTGNSIGLLGTTFGQVLTYQTNKVDGNDDDIVGSVTPIATK